MRNILPTVTKTTVTTNDAGTHWDIHLDDVRFWVGEANDTLTGETQNFPLSEEIRHGSDASYLEIPCRSDWLGEIGHQFSDDLWVILRDKNGDVGEFCSPTDFSHICGPDKPSTFDFGAVGDHRLTIHTSPKHGDDLVNALLAMDAEEQELWQERRDRKAAREEYDEELRAKQAEAADREG